MCDPIIDSSIRPHIEPFEKPVVKEYLESKGSFDKYPLRHYSQLELIFDEDEVKTLFNKLGIPIVNTHVTIFGGYTGQFAKCLRKIGMQVTFTDPLEEWVQKATDSGFEAYKYAAEEIPRDMVKRTDLFATFECYKPFVDSSVSIYTTLRFLTSKHGILFAESKRTRNELKKEEGARAMLKYSFRGFSKFYLIKRIFREHGDLRLYHFCSEENSKKIIKTDCKVMRAIYDDFPDRTYLDKKTIVYFADKIGMNEEEILNSLERILNSYLIDIPRFARIYVPNNMFRVFSKGFHVDLGVFRAR